MSEGGLATAFAESALGFGFGAELDLGQISAETDSLESMLFGESAGRFVVSLAPENAARFESLMAGSTCRKAGRVRGDKRFIIKKGQTMIINEPIEDIWKAYNRGI